MHNKSSEVCIKTRSTPASLPFKSQDTKPTAVKRSIGEIVTKNCFKIFLQNLVDGRASFNLSSNWFSLKIARRALCKLTWFTLFDRIWFHPVKGRNRQKPNLWPIFKKNVWVDWGPVLGTDYRHCLWTSVNGTRY